MRVEADDQRSTEKRMGLKGEKKIALHEFHSSLEDDENKYWDENAREVDEAGRRGESHAMFAAVKF